MSPAPSGATNPVFLVLLDPDLGARGVAQLRFAQQRDLLILRQLTVLVGELEA